MSEKKGPDGETPGKEPVCVGNIFWRLLQCCLICAVIALIYHDFILERENKELLERYLKIERENLRLSKMWLDLDKKVQTLWNEEDHHAYDVSVQERKVNGLDEDAVVGRMKRDTLEKIETAGNLPEYLPKFDERSENVMAVHVEAWADEYTEEEYQIEGGLNNILAKWQPLHYPHDGFTLDVSALTVLKAGLYFIYSQVSYVNDDGEQAPISHSVVVGEDNFLTCVDTLTGSPPHHTCYTAGVKSLEANSIVEIMIQCEGCSISLKGDGTFFGAILLKEYESASPMKYEFMDIFFPNELGD